MQALKIRRRKRRSEASIGNKMEEKEIRKAKRFD